jgi:PAS domain S-box-containing protein
MEKVQDELERTAKYNEAQVHAILEAAVNGIITIDRHGRIQLCNHAAEKLFGYTTKELVGQSVSILMPEPFRHEHDGYIRRYLYTGQKSVIGVGRETVAMRKDGSVFPIELSVSEARVGDDVIFTGIVRDITERKRLEKEILEISEREQRRIGQDLHDGLCQQLTGIAFLVQALQQKLSSRDAASAVQAAQVSVLLKESVTHARILYLVFYIVFSDAV